MLLLQVGDIASKVNSITESLCEAEIKYCTQNKLYKMLWTVVILLSVTCEKYNIL